MPLILLSALLHGYVALRLVPDLDVLAAVAAGLLVLVSALLMPLALLARRLRPRRVAQWLSWAGMWCLGLFSSLLVLTLMRDALLLLAWIAAAVQPALAPVAPLRAHTALAVPLLALAITLIGLWNARRTAAVVRVDVPIRGLPEALHGFSIAQISDLHVGPTIRRGYLQAVVDKVNRLGADMVAVTGDLVDGPVHELAAHVAPLAGLLSRHGTYFVTGNHEYYSGAAGWIIELRRLGLRVLMNEHVVLQHDAAVLLVAGVADYGAHHFERAHRSDPQAALRGAPAQALVRLLLAHQPRTATAAARAGYQLQLSGHTHGGQFWPWNFFVRYQQPFTAGLHRLADLWVYTSRGTGYWGPPKRFGAPSEITHLRLMPAP
jgi:predicted MPP superfamily phosphohydrolase